MTEAVARGNVEPTLRARGPGYSVMQECLRVQAAATPLGTVARFFGGSPLHPDARSWYRGALGEIEVARVLSRLGTGWTVLHAVPVGSGDSDIDHVVIGPPGIFTINTKNHSGQKIFVGGGTFMVNGHKQDHMRNSLHEAGRASRLLSAISGGPVDVTPLIVVVDPASLVTGRKRPKVTVLPAVRLARWLSKRPRAHSDAAVAYLSMIAEERGTWHARARVLDDTLRHVQRFDRLRREVDAARRRSRHIKLLMMAGFVALVVCTSLVIASALLAT